MRLYNDVIRATNDGKAFLPEAEDVPACESFAAGYAAGAELDRRWIGDPNRWAFAVAIAYLGGRRDLVPIKTLAEFEADPECKSDICAELGEVIADAHETFRKVRRTALTPRTTARVGRNEPCPCGSGKKSKRCCIGRSPSA